MVTSLLRSRLVALGLSSLVATGCATTNRAGVASGADGRPTVDARRMAASEAHGRLQLALDQRDASRVAAVLHQDVVLIVAPRDTVRGRADVARFLTTVASDSVQTLRFGNGRLEPCLEGGVLEYEGYFSSAPIRGVDGERRFSILWSTDGQQASARRLALAADLPAVRRGLSCRFEYLVAARQHRLTISASAELSVPGSSGAGRDVESAMRSSDLTYTASVQASGPASRAYPFIKGGAGGVGASVRYRFQPSFSGELQLAHRLKETVQGLNNATRRYVAAETAPVTVAALAQVQRGPVRVGAGPAALFGNWTVREERRTIYIYQQQSYWGKIPPEPQSAHSWAPAFGGAAELAFMLPMSRHLLGEVRVSAAAFGGGDVPATETFPGAKVSNRLMKLGLSIGKGW